MLQNFVSASPAVKPTVFTGDGIMAVFGAPVAAGFRQLERYGRIAPTAGG
jgi:hypothetical protein